MSQTWAPEWDERWDGPRDQSSRRKATESALAFLRPDADEPEDKYAYVWKRWSNPAYRDHRRRELLLEQVENAKAQHWQLRVFAAAHGEAYAEGLRQWLIEEVNLAPLTDDVAAWLATQNFRPYEPDYVDPYSLKAKLARAEA